MGELSHPRADPDYLVIIDACTIHLRFHGKLLYM